MCALSTKPVGVKLHAPVASAVVVPSVTPPSLMVTSVLACPVPLTAGLEVMSVGRRAAGVRDQRLAHNRRRLVERKAQRRRPGVAGEIGLGRGERVRAVRQTVGVKLQAPVPSAVAVPSVTPPSLIVTSVLASPVPLTARVRGDLVGRRGAGVGNQRHAHWRRRLVERETQRRRRCVAGEIGLAAVSVCAPLASPAGVKLQAPEPSAIVVPSVAPPSLMATSVLA